ncbi:Kinase, NEK [Giardia muris]|uniref:Kinase, NEK n=1 Tax=Giardia muris TaxID=5742 RepID=A0A4Z1SVN8_GIAMU|nr:Kinase, NEK [Giardia muris]|eukprot:TNJ28975.1 Kinase, NEK [Giardia muris]
MSITDLMRAARYGDLKGVKRNLNQVRKKDEYGQTALIWAAKNGHSDCIPFLKEELGMQNKRGWTALMWAAFNGKTDCVRLLLSESGKQTTKNSRFTSDGRMVFFPSGTTALMMAAHENYPEIVELLLPYEQGMEDSEGRTAQWYANDSSKEGDYSRVRQLLKNEGSERILPPPNPGEMLELRERVNELTTEIESLKKDLASSKNAHEETKKELSQSNREVSSLKQQLQKANEEAKKNHELNETLNKRTQEAEKSPAEARGEVFSSKVQLSKTDEDHSHVYTDSEAPRKELADQKAQNPALENENTLLKNGSLIPAAIKGDLNTLRRHIDQAGKRGSSGMTALMHAASRGQTEVVRLLRPLEARLQDGRGWTALMHAVGRGHEECVGLLLLERDLRDGEGRTAAEHAESEKMRRVLLNQPTLPRLPDSLSVYCLTTVIGGGAFGTVYAAHKSGRNVAVKVIDLGKYNKKERELLRREAEILPSLDHPNIIRCIDAGEDDHDDTCVIVTDLCCGDLREEMDRRKKANSSYSDQEVWKTIREVAAALAYLHEKRHVHRDLKPANVFLAPDGRCILGDFGVARALGDSSRMNTHTGTDLYMAPEIHQGKRYDNSVDVWALGVVAHELCTGELPFFTVPAILERGPPAIENRDGGLVTLISRMLSKDPEDRPTAQDVLEEAERHQ